MVLQLELGIKPIVKFNFENFVVSESNLQIISHLKALTTGQDSFLQDNYIYLWGSKSTGKSHLLHAIVEEATHNNLSAIYFSFESSVLNSSDHSDILGILDNLESFDIICLDNIQNIVGFTQWEEALFGFYNLIKDANKKLIITSDCSVNTLDIKLADLKSRLAWGVSYNLKSLSDQDKITLLQTKANDRGISLSYDLAQFLIVRASRDISSLFEILDKLDQASLRQKRMLTIPFAKSVLGL